MLSGGAGRDARDSDASPARPGYLTTTNGQNDLADRPSDLLVASNRSRTDAFGGDSSISVPYSARTRRPRNQMRNVGRPMYDSDSSDADDFSYEVWGPDLIRARMNLAIEEVAQVTNSPLAVARMLLVHYKWDKERLLEKYYEDPDNPRLLMKNAGVSEGVLKRALEAIANPDSSPTLGRKQIVLRGNFNCEICMEDIKPGDEGLDVGCGHKFCRPCWTDYLKTKILDGGLSEWVTCPYPKCDQLVEHATILTLLKHDERIHALYDRFLSNSYVQSNSLLKWCPSPDCEYAVKVPYRVREPTLVRCKCKAKFCVGCGEEWHEPASCYALMQWLRKGERDGPTLQWIASNTKECPKCHVPIEKDGGCNHVLCKSPTCKYDFCWVCLGPWESHGSSWYSCNRYEASEAKAARDAQQANRVYLNRYLHYYSRYVNHRQSIEFERNLYDSVRKKAEEVITDQPRLTWVDLQFLTRAVDVLLDCRQTLKYTYVFAYYLKTCNQGDIFEDNQRDLENATETLSEYLEREINADNFVDIKQKVHDKLTYCGVRRQVLVDHVNEGTEKDWWDFDFSSPQAQ